MDVIESLWWQQAERWGAVVICLARPPRTAGTRSPGAQASGPGKKLSDGFSAALCHGGGHDSTEPSCQRLQIEMAAPPPERAPPTWADRIQRLVEGP